EARAQLLAEARIAQTRDPLGGWESAQVPPVEHAVEERRTPPPVEGPHEGLRAQHREDRGPPLARALEKPALVVPALARTGTVAHPLHDRRQPGAMGELDQSLAVTGVVALHRTGGEIRDAPRTALSRGRRQLGHLLEAGTA